MNKNDFVESFLRPACMWLTHAFVGSLLSVVLALIAPIFLSIFEDCGAELPTLTIRLFDLSIMMCNYWYLIIPFLAIIDAAMLFGLSQVPPKQMWLRSLWFNAIMLAAILFLFFSIIALALPILSMDTSLS